MSELAEFSSEIEALARRLVGEGGSDPGRADAARAVAEAQLDLRRIRSAKRHLIERALERYSCVDPAAADDSATALRITATERPPSPPAASTLALALTDAASDLLRLDRYERRALSRRRTAIRKLIS